MSPVQAQRVAVKTNALYWATTTPNLGVELTLSPAVTLDLAGSFNPWKFGSGESEKKIIHFSLRPEVRFWPYERWDGHFLGIHGLWTSYNAGGVRIPLSPLDNLKNSRYEGYAAGAGFSYGYHWILSPHWNLELTAGIGYLYFNYDRYRCGKCGEPLGSAHKHWFGPTNLGVSFIYLFKERKSGL